ncbi:MAG TPA: SAP domain-containing protein, partial [Clostridia bacterium]|nr:SAP domain-containing protein [Clostridia bacterium]
MKFDDAVSLIGTVKELKRIASAHVVDYRNLNDEELREALIKVKPQYLHYETVKNNIHQIFFNGEKELPRVLSQIILKDVLLNEDGYILNCCETTEKVMAIEQRIINQSNEIEIADMAASKSNPQRLRDFELYFFVLQVAWEHQSSKSADEDNLLRKLRTKLLINDWDHRVMEAKLGKFPKPNNELHSRGEIDLVRRQLQGMGLLFSIRDEKGAVFDLIPEELASVMRLVLNLEIKNPNYSLLLKHKMVRKKQFLQKCLENYGVGWNNKDTVDTLSKKILHYIQPSTLLGGVEGKDGLSKDDLYKWCAELGLPVSGSKQELINRIVLHYDSLRQTIIESEDERKIWYDMYKELAFRDYDFLRSHNVISKDVEIESKFEEATSYLFQFKLNHTPLKQVGTNHPDGVLSFKDMYVMWDNKSKEQPGKVSLKEHLKQFHDYMEKSDKAVPIFLVIAPDFTEDSEAIALKYTAKHFGRNIVLIKAEELKDLAEEWNHETNRQR